MNANDIRSALTPGMNLLVRFAGVPARAEVDIRVGKLKIILEDTIVLDKFPNSELSKDSTFECNLDGRSLIPIADIKEIMIL